MFDLTEPWTRGSLAPFTPHDEAKWDARRQLRDDANRALEAARRDKLVGASLDAKVVVAPPADAEKRAAFDASLAGLADTSQVIAPHGKDIADAVDDLRFLFLVSDVEVVDSSDAVCGVCADQHVVSSADSFTGATVGVVEASTARCARCWYHDSTVGSLANHPALCARCGDAVGDERRAGDFHVAICARGPPRRARQQPTAPGAPPRRRGGGCLSGTAPARSPAGQPTAAIVVVAAGAAVYRRPGAPRSHSLPPSSRPQPSVPRAAVAAGFPRRVGPRAASARSRARHVLVCFGLLRPSRRPRTARPRAAPPPSRPPC